MTFIPFFLPSFISFQGTIKLTTSLNGVLLMVSIFFSASILAQQSGSIDVVKESRQILQMAEYIDLLQKEPTKFRIFLWNILKEIPALQADFQYPDFGLKLLKGLPMLFFGGTESYTFMHYDIDLANIFHFHFQGRKEIILFDQNQNKHLYKVPHSLITHESIDFSNPDYAQWPALKNASGHKTYLEHGEVLYIPEGYWHYMKYVTPGFSMSLRAMARNPLNLSKAAYNILIMRYYDTFMRRIQGQKWIDNKNQRAINRTNAYIQ